VLYVTISCGRLAVCDANDVFKRNLIDHIVEDETIFDLVDQIFIEDDLPRCYDALTQLYCGLADEVDVALRLEDTVDCATGWMAAERTRPVATQARLRFAISDDGQDATYGICLLPPHAVQ